MGIKPVIIGIDGFLIESAGTVGSDEKQNVILSGLYDRINRDFLLPEGALHTPPRPVVKVYHGGRRLDPYEYVVLESVSGSGTFDLVRLTSWAPGPDNRLIVDYVPA
jgi:hypothetical protein